MQQAINWPDSASPDFTNDDRPSLARTVSFPIFNGNNLA